MNDIDSALPAAVREEVELARAFLDRGDVTSAEDRIRELIAQYPRLAALHLELGRLRLHTHDQEGAVQSLGRAVDLDPGNPAAWLSLGELLGLLGRVEPARDALRRALALVGHDAERGRVHAAMGRLHAHAGQAARAVRELRKAAAALPEDVEIAGELGRALAAAGDNEAAAWLERAASVPGADPALVVQAARALQNAAVAERVLRGALERMPDEQRVRAALAHTLADAGRPAEALPMALQAVSAAPNDAEVLAALRATFIRAGRWADALEVARREAATDRPLPTRDWIELALGAGSKPALAAAERGGGDDALVGAARAFADGRATRDQLLLLASVAPDEQARRFVVAAAAPPPPVSGNLFSLLQFAHELTVRNAELASLAPAAAHAMEAFDRPLLVAVMGEFNAGKSSLVNALCGAEVAPVGVTPTTATVNILRHGPPGGRVLYHDGSSRELAGDEVAAFLRTLSPGAAAAVRVVEVFWPVEQLRRVEVVDTPGMNSILPEHERVARAFLVDADAILWVFAIGQAAKASERDALGLARAAGKRVLGVLNKVDRADPTEVDEVTRHVTASFGDALDSVVAFSAKQALQARRSGDEAAAADSGLQRLERSLDERFFGDARTLKRRTALGWLHRFVAEARRLVPPEPEGTGVDERDALRRLEDELTGALARERIALRGRIAEAYRATAYEIRDLVRPRTWLFGEHRAERADREFVVELLDDSLARATEQSGEALLSAARSVDGAAAALPAVERAVAAAVDRFSAYCRGVLDGGALERFFEEELPRLELEVAAIRNALARHAPEPDEPFFRALQDQLRQGLTSARDALDRHQHRLAAERLLRAESLTGPLDALDAAVSQLDA